MADPPSPTPSMASPEQHRNNGVLDPPPLQAFHEDESIFRNDLNFTLRITEKLTEQNYHLWRQQVEPYINAHGLDDLIGPAPAPPHFLTVADHASATLNPLYRKWRRQDQMLLSWLQSTLSSEILARFLGSHTSQDLWAKQLTVLHIPGPDQLADVLTKPISSDKFLLMRSKLTVRDYTDLEGAAGPSGLRRSPMKRKNDNAIPYVPHASTGPNRITKSARIATDAADLIGTQQFVNKP
ncbi:hypothetical protein TSUD_366440 [Trifolium subterraneum]|uniref:Retrotransposon Copia-like N-terminal domain-containing protein n=1 Tax=Trifolium subterraneum TaxID=3900 RepID=A0A2Z6LQ48_TRISU|nr:hypothetical protein TSUD_366440 [Trifolium subterraneum]